MVAARSERLPRELAQVGPSRVFLLEDGVYHMELAGRLTCAHLMDVHRAIWAHLLERTDYATVVTWGKDGYDPDVRHFHRQVGTRPAVEVACVTSNAVERMVIATIAIGVRALLNTPLHAYPSVDEARAACVRALAIWREAPGKPG